MVCTQLAKDRFQWRAFGKEKNEHSGFIKGDEYLGKLSDSWEILYSTSLSVNTFIRNYFYGWRVQCKE
jgi:hypothetical protein